MNVRAAFLLLTLAACASAPDATVSFPMSAPDGATELVSRFVDVCTAAIAEGGAWVVPASQWERAEDETRFGGVDAFKSGDITLTISRIETPHLRGLHCQMFEYRFDDPDDVDTSGSALRAIESLEGFTGTVSRPVGGGPYFLGQWSAIGPDGTPIMMTAMHTHPKMVHLSMSQTRHVP